MRKQYDILVLSDPASKAKQKWPVRPSRRTKYQARRGTARINFWDLARVNVGTAASPVYQDHPIVKVPGYTADVLMSGPFTLGAQYTIDPFTASDYAAYTQMFFDVGPVEEWKNLFKKVAYSPDETHALHVRYPPMTGLVNTVQMNTTTGQFDTYSMEWLPNGLRYKDFTELTFLHNVTQHNWFSGSTQRKTIYYLTATYDPLAADVSDLTISGNIEVYLMPHIGLFIGASYNGPRVSDGFEYSGTEGVQVLGPWYQVIPRDHWDGYSVGTNAADNAAYLDYQKNRSGAIASDFTVAMGGGSITTNTIDPLTFADGNFTYRTESALNDLSANFYNGSAGVYYASGGASSAILWENDQPFLMAVIKAHGHFYYCWSLVDEFGDEQAAAESSAYIPFQATDYPAGDEPP